jgi:hypothetical protein
MSVRVLDSFPFSVIFPSFKFFLSNFFDKKNKKSSKAELLNNVRMSSFQAHTLLTAKSLLPSGGWPLAIAIPAPLSTLPSLPAGSFTGCALAALAAATLSAAGTAAAIQSDPLCIWPIRTSAFPLLT